MSEIAYLIEELTSCSDEELWEALDGLPPWMIELVLGALNSSSTVASAPPSPLAQAQELDGLYQNRPHLDFLDARLAQAVKDVEAGQNRMLMVSMPPRMGKSQLSAVYLPTWILRRHPSWKLGIISHSPDLAVGWGRQVRRLVEEFPSLGISIAPDAGAVGHWETTRWGSLVSRSMGQSPTGLGFKVLILDDPVKDFASAHNEAERERLWNNWQANIVTRLEAPYLVVAVGTRWHEGDLLGRLINPDYGEPDKWEVISFPAVAEEEDALGRSPGEPLYSPLLDESREEALERWDEVKRSVGSYVWQALYQQSPSPAKGDIFNADWWRFWTRDPERVTDRIRLLPPLPELERGRWLDSWDFTSTASDTGDYVVGQRWARVGARRFLIAQQRGRWAFTDQLSRMKRWALVNDDALSPYGRLVHRRLVEAAANGQAIIDTLKQHLSGIKPINPRNSKEVRARAVTPEIESGHVYLPNPAEPGNEWVLEFLSEMKSFPNGKNDDQVDALSQALADLRDEGASRIVNPALMGRADYSPAQSARSDLRRTRLR